MGFGLLKLKILRLNLNFFAISSSDRNNFLFFVISTLNSPKLTKKPKVGARAYNVKEKKAFYFGSDPNPHL